MKIELTPSSTRASFRAASFNPDDHTIELTWSTGAPVRRQTADGRRYVELLTMTAEACDLTRLNAGAPFLDSHRDNDLAHVLGSIVPNSARIIGGRGIARVLLSRAAGDADTIQKIKDGIITNVSVGYAVDELEIVQQEDADPIYKITKWTPFEISGVAIGADAGSQIAQTGKRKASGGSSPATARAIPADSVDACRARMTVKHLSRNIPFHVGTQH
jgi:hypothetical protein